MDIGIVNAVKKTLTAYIRCQRIIDQNERNPLARKAEDDLIEGSIEGSCDKSGKYIDFRMKATEAFADEFNAGFVRGRDLNLIRRELLSKVGKQKLGERGERYNLMTIFSDLPELLDQLPSYEAGCLVRLLIDQDLILRLQYSDLFGHVSTEDNRLNAASFFVQVNTETRDLALSLEPKTLMPINKPSEPQNPSEAKPRKRF